MRKGLLEHPTDHLNFSPPPRNESGIAFYIIVEMGANAS